MIGIPSASGGGESIKGCLEIRLLKKQKERRMKCKRNY